MLMEILSVIEPRIAGSALGDLGPEIVAIEVDMFEQILSTVKRLGAYPASQLFGICLWCRFRCVGAVTGRFCVNLQSNDG